MKTCFTFFSGALATCDILNAEAVGKAPFKIFIQKRLFAKTLKYHAPLPRQSLKCVWFSCKDQEAKVLEDEDSPNISTTESLLTAANSL